MKVLGVLRTFFQEGSEWGVGQSPAIFSSGADFSHALNGFFDDENQHHSGCNSENLGKRGDRFGKAGVPRAVHGTAWSDTILFREQERS